MIGIGSGVAAGAALAAGCLGPGGAPLVGLGFVLLAVSLVAQGIALKNLRSDPESSKPRVELSGYDSQDDPSSGTPRVAAASLSVRSLKTFIGPGEEHKTMFAGGEVVVFYEPMGGPEIVRSVPVAPGPTQVRLKENRGATGSVFSVDQ